MSEEYDTYKLSDLVEEIDDKDAWRYPINFNFNGKTLFLKDITVKEIIVNHETKKCTVVIEKSNK